VEGVGLGIIQDTMAIAWTEKLRSYNFQNSSLC